MIKYYTRACNFKYGKKAKELIKNNLALPLCGNNSISFEDIEVITRNSNKVSSKTINFKKINKLKVEQKKKLKKTLKKLQLKGKIF